MRRGWNVFSCRHLSRAICLVLLSGSLAAAQSPAAPEGAPKQPTRLGTMTEGNIDKSMGGFRQVLEAAKHLDAAKATYAADKDTLSQLLAAQQALTSAQI